MARRESHEPSQTPQVTLEQLEHYRREFAHDPGSLVFATLAEACRQHGLLEEGEAACRQGLTIHPGHLAGRLAMARIHQARGDVVGAEHEYFTALRYHPDNAVARKALAGLQLSQGNPEGALEHLHLALFVAPGDKEAQTLFAQAQSLKQRKRRAPDKVPKPAPPAPPPPPREASAAAAVPVAVSPEVPPPASAAISAQTVAQVNQIIDRLLMLEGVQGVAVAEPSSGALLLKGNWAIGGDGTRQGLVELSRLQEQGGIIALLGRLRGGILETGGDTLLFRTGADYAMGISLAPGTKIGLIQMALTEGEPGTDAHS